MSAPEAAKKKADRDGGGADGHLGAAELAALYERVCNFTEVVAAASAVGFFMLVVVAWDLDSMKQQALSGLAMQVLQTAALLAAGAWVHATVCLRRDAADAGVPRDALEPRRLTPAVAAALALGVAALQTRTVVASKQMSSHAQRELEQVRRALEGLPGSHPGR